MPTAVICSDAYLPSAKAIAKIGGIPDYPFVVVPHPLVSLDPETLLGRAMGAVPQVLRILLGGR